MSGIRFFLLSALLGASLLFTSACSGGYEAPSELSDFGIYLKDTGELVISGEHIEAYHIYYDDHRMMTGSDFREEMGDSVHTIELNPEGIEQWNSFRKFDGKLLAASLYHKDFVVKLSGKKMYEGVFSSMASSCIYDGVVIMESIIGMNEEDNRFHIFDAGASIGAAPAEGLINAPEIIGFMEEHGLLE
jgi:hypothetical protein